MKLVSYNIAYSTGPHRNFWQIICSWFRFLKPRKNRHNLADIINYLKECDADIVALLEIRCDEKKSRVNRNQAKLIAEALGYDIISEIKYDKESWHRRLPFLKQQGNALLSKHELQMQNFHFFPFGVKRLIIEIEINDIAIFVVHLALGEKTRNQQFDYLTKLIKKLHYKKNKSIIIAGDFNTFRGDCEIENLCRELKLTTANKDNIKTFPAWSPHHELDFILHSEDIKVNQFMVEHHIMFSDHLPLVIDFEKN